MSSTKDPPRLTTAIRKLGDVTEQNLNDSSDQNIHVNGVCSLAEKKAFNIKRDEQRTLTWNSFLELLKKMVNYTDFNEFQNACNTIHHISFSIAGRDLPPDMLKTAGVVLFFHLLDDPTKKGVSVASLSKIKRDLGPCEQHLVEPALRSVQNIKSHLNSEEDNINQLKYAFMNGPSASEGLPPGFSAPTMFGTKIKFHIPKYIHSKGSVTDLNKEERRFFDAYSATHNQSNSPMLLSEIQKLIESDTQSKSTVLRGACANPQSADTSALPMEWLQNRLMNIAPELELSCADLSNSVLEILASSSSNEAIQSLLFDLIGLGGFEVIQEILAKRKDILAVHFNSKGDRQTSSVNITKSVALLNEKEAQSHNGVVNGDIVERLRNNPEAVARQRDLDEQFYQSIKRHHDPSIRVPQSSTVKYPFVFDQMDDVKMSAAFVGGAKLTLPESCVRKVLTLHEEVVFPPHNKPPDTMEFKRIYIKDLDKLSQTVFQNTTSLNLIQSVVYHAAHGSNENLLISAPTGAGKTNIAMLTVLHEIKQHLTAGNVIKKDDFKVIYIAPMKALAAEMTRNFGDRLAPLGIKVRECTGDMQLTKTEMIQTQMLVTTPEKWDVITRKSSGDVTLVNLVKLLIIDEVHLLHEERGAVIESLVARTLRQVESSQRMIRIVGLSATLPNYLDVARFLRVNPHKGLFFFDSRFRPVPLGQTFVGIRATNRFKAMDDMNIVCYQKVVEVLKKEEQVMVFVHSRGETFKTANFMREYAKNECELKYFLADQCVNNYNLATKSAGRLRDSILRDLYNDGLGCHHAGMLRSDRNIVERLFSEGHIRVLVCTSTLAWGVNLPAHAVVIKGTQIYNAEKSQMMDLGILDVLQIFGRAGRPQFDKVGFGTIITTHDKLSHYLSLITRQNPIESQFHNCLTDNLNAEIALGTVSNVDDAVKWLSYTYFFVRLKKNPLFYGIPYTLFESDPELNTHREDLIRIAARNLDKSRMIRFDERTGYMASTDLGRTASHYYIKFATVDVLNEFFKSEMIEQEIFGMIGRASEFSNVKVREEEGEELNRILYEACRIKLHKDGLTDTAGKINVLLQSYISRNNIETFSLVSDQAYVQQNAARLVRCLFEIALRRGWPLMAARLLELCKMIEKRIWSEDTPLWQFESDLKATVLHKIDDRELTIDKIREMHNDELGMILRDKSNASQVKRLAYALPLIQMSAEVQPITRTVVRLRLTLTPDFTWNNRFHGVNSSEGFWIWVEDPENAHIYHSEFFTLNSKQVSKKESQYLVFTIPVFEPLPSQYLVRCISDRWLGSDTTIPISFKRMILPEAHPPHTDLLDLQPLPVTALKNSALELLFSFSHFNPIQTQIFHTLYHTDSNVLLGAPTGSGKTVAAELAIFRVFNCYPGKKCVYIAPLKALVRERIDDWKLRIEKRLGKKVVELTGDVTPDMRAVASADLIVTTPEKWDGVSRSWQQRSYVQDVMLIVIDEIHLLGEDRGPVLEVIVSRTNFIFSRTKQTVRIVGLSTALANARDLAGWLNISSLGLFNFRPSVRPVPLEVHIQGYPGRHFCPRMATMNKPIYQAIRTHSPCKPVLCFVSSRRQTRLTAFDLIAFLAGEDNPKQWVNIDEQELQNLIKMIQESNLKLCLAFGIGLHHAGLIERDRKIVEELFVNQKIQVLIATSTLAWGVNFPAHLVVVKGTEYFDGKNKRYVDYPITDVMQMMGRAGRPQFDDQGKAVIMVHDIKKHFYKKFLYEPFPVESCLLAVLPDHLNAEIVAGTINSKQDAVDYITGTYLFRRLLVNPTYYNLESVDHNSLNIYLSRLVATSLGELELSHCVEVGDDNFSIEALTAGQISSYYYLNHKTMRLFKERLSSNVTLLDILDILCKTEEYAELPVRHNEDQLNAELAKVCPIEVSSNSLDSPHTKAHLLFQAHFCREKLPIADYNTDTKSILDQAIRILQAIIDFSAAQGWLATCLRSTQLIQMIVQGRWLEDSTLLQLPNVESFHLVAFCNGANGPIIETLPELIEHVGNKKEKLSKMLKDIFAREAFDKLFQVLQQYPLIEYQVAIRGKWQESEDNVIEKLIPPSFSSGTRNNKNWIKVHADQEYILKIKLNKLNWLIKSKDTRAITPRFHKPKDEGWILMLGDPDQRELLAIKRVPVLHHASTSVHLVFYSPEKTGRKVFYLYAMSDAYLGLDQQVLIQLDVIPACPRFQENDSSESENDED